MAAEETNKKEESVQNTEIQDDSPQTPSGMEDPSDTKKETQPSMGISSFDTLFQAAKSFFNSDGDDTNREDTQSGFGMMDVSETDDAFVFYVDCPGMQKSDIDIRVNGNRMTITGTRAIEPSEQRTRSIARRFFPTTLSSIRSPLATKTECLSFRSARNARMRTAF